MDKMTDSRAVEVLSEMREGDVLIDEADYVAAIDHAIASLREPAGVGGEFDAEAVAWAYGKLRDFGCYTREAGAMMGDRLNMMLLDPPDAPHPHAEAPYERLFMDAMSIAQDAMDYVQTHQDEFGARPGDDKLAIVCREFLKSRQLPAEAQAQGGGEVVAPMTGDLLPCPFCGNEVQDDEGCFQSTGFHSTATPVWSVRCGNPECNADVSATSEATVVAAWNRRATAAKDAEIAQLEKANEQLHAHGERMHAEIAGWKLAEKSEHDLRMEAEAEIEALRMEVDQTQASVRVWRRLAETTDARAERLAEALQWYVDNDDTNDGEEGNEFWLAGRDRARALLRDQEKWK